MAYFNKQETQDRIAKVVKLLNEKDTDIAVIYFDELNIANGWYLTGWCGQFEKGAVLVGRDGTTMLLGGPESEPFAKQSSAISDTRCFKVFMVPDEEYPLAFVVVVEGGGYGSAACVPVLSKVLRACQEVLDGN